MHNYQLIFDYKDNPKYRKSFNSLSRKTFGIDFENWYKEGFWNENYVCYSYLDKDKVISNISINYMDVIINGENKKAIQLATVMTDKDYRHKGLAASLMNTIIMKHEKDYDFFYLSANETVLDFYPKFGFQLKEETQFILPVHFENNKNNIRKLEISNQDDLNILLNLKRKSKPVSRILGTQKDEHILIFYCLNLLKDNIYYLEDKNTIVIYDVKGDTLNLFDIISSEDIDINIILNEILYSDIKKVVFHFTPDFDNENLIYKKDISNYRFIRPATTYLPDKFVFSQISQT